MLAQEYFPEVAEILQTLPYTRNSSAPLTFGGRVLDDGRKYFGCSRTL